MKRAQIIDKHEGYLSLLLAGFQASVTSDKNANEESFRAFDKKWKQYCQRANLFKGAPKCDPSEFKRQVEFSIKVAKIRKIDPTIKPEDIALWSDELIDKYIVTNSKPTN